MWFNLSKIILKNRLTFIIIIGVITLIMGYLAQFARMSYQMAQLLPQTDSTFIEYKNFKSTFGNDGSIVVVGINNPELYQLNNFNASCDIENIFNCFCKGEGSKKI